MLAKTVHNSDLAALVDESLQGLLLTRPDLELVAPAHHRIIARRAINPALVALVCGGGAGHEPAHAAFVGAGMLTAAVSGDVFASPTAPAVERAVLHAAGGAASCRASAGVLLIIKNYTGDRLAFAAAAERARALGARVETVYVCDDAALEGGACIGRRGLAGTVLVYKVAGALAEAGAPLQAVAAAARAAAERVHTYGCSLTACLIPGRAPSERLAGGAMELGLGIHGEPGATRLEAVPSASELCATMLAACAARLRSTLSSSGGGGGGSGGVLDVALLVNNYGALSALEQGVAVRSAVAWLEAAEPQLRLRRLIAGPVMTSLGMRGFSLTLLALGPLLPPPPLPGAAWAGESSAEALLDAPVACGSAWPGAAAPLPGQAALSLRALAPRQPQGPLGSASGGALAAFLAPPPAAAAAAADPPPSPATAALALACLEAAAGALCAAEAALNALDAAVGDGDCGSTCAAMARAALAACAPPLRALACGAPAPTGASAADALRNPSLRPLLAALLRDAGDALAEQCGGSSGLLYAILLRSAAGALLAQPQPQPQQQQQQRAPAAAPDSLQGYSEAFLAALAGVGVAANSRPGQRSMLDALHPAACALAGGGAAGGLCAEVLEGVAAAASAGAGATAAMAPVAGRSCWVAPEVARGVQDPGAAAAAAWVGAVAGALKELLGAAGAGQAPAQ